MVFAVFCAGALALDVGGWYADGVKNLFVSVAGVCWVAGAFFYALEQWLKGRVHFIGAGIIMLRFGGWLGIAGVLLVISKCPTSLVFHPAFVWASIGLISVTFLLVGVMLILSALSHLVLKNSVHLMKLWGAFILGMMLIIMSVVSISAFGLVSYQQAIIGTVFVAAVMVGVWIGCLYLFEKFFESLT